MCSLLSWKFPFPAGNAIAVLGWILWPKKLKSYWVLQMKNILACGSPRYGPTQIVKYLFPWIIAGKTMSLILLEAVTTGLKEITQWFNLERRHPSTDQETEFVGVLIHTKRFTMFVFESIFWLVTPCKVRHICRFYGTDSAETGLYKESPWYAEI